MNFSRNVSHLERISFTILYAFLFTASSCADNQTLEERNTEKKGTCLNFLVESHSMNMQQNFSGRHTSNVLIIRGLIKGSQLHYFYEQKLPVKKKGKNPCIIVIFLATKVGGLLLREGGLLFGGIRYSTKVFITKGHLLFILTCTVNSRYLEVVGTIFYKFNYSKC